MLLLCLSKATNSLKIWRFTKSHAPWGLKAHKWTSLFISVLFFCMNVIFYNPWLFIAIPGLWAAYNAYPLKRTFIASNSNKRNTQAAPCRGLASTGQVGVMQVEVLGGFLISEREHLHPSLIAMVNSAHNYYSTSTFPGLLVSYTITSVWMEIHEN